MDGQAATLMYEVVRNDEEQYSIWPQGRALPAGWYEVGFSGGQTECLEHIRRVWTDMRPKSLREKMDADSAQAGAGASPG